MSEPREFWLEIGEVSPGVHLACTDPRPFKNAPSYHVIEYAALEQEVMRIEGVLRGEYEKRVRELEKALQNIRIQAVVNGVEGHQALVARISRVLDHSHMGMFDDEGTKV